MDALGLTVLLTELEVDCGVVADASQKSTARLREKHPGHLEACAYEVARLYNVLEKMLEQICVEFENHFEKRGDYHEKLLQRLSLNLEGIRPAFIPRNQIQNIRELKGFRHLTRHAYDLVLKEARLTEIVGLAEQVAREVPTWCREFGESVRRQQGW